jgi:hypothetical protein
MKDRITHQVITGFIALVWLVNGLFCKVFNLVPRHGEIVRSILRTDHARLLTLSIGVLETGMAVWIMSALWPRVNAWTQIVVVAAMNLLEFILVPDLLLFGRANAFFAFLFIALIYYNQLYKKDKIILTP